MRSLLVRLEGLLMASVGTALAALALGPYYPYLMNPRYRWLSVIGLGAVAAIGIVRLASPRGSPRLSRIVSFAVLVALCALGLRGLQQLYARAPESRAPGAGGWEPLVEAGDLPAGYLPINTAELYLLAQDEAAGSLEGMRYVVRVFMYCCAADATAVGFRVPLADGLEGASSGDLSDGQWVRVAGRLEVLAVPEDLSGQVRTAGTFYTALQPRCRLVPDRIDAVAPPSAPFIYELNSEPPFAY